MSRLHHILTITLLMLSGVGCQYMPTRHRQARYVDPALPMAMNRDELVTYLNKQNQDLNSWRSTNTRMHVKLPNGLSSKLKGAIACQAPMYFRLTASGTFASADLGSNASRCWVYAKPGESAVMTWRHEDTALLQQMPTGMPYIDPNWLMLVLGITPLDAADYDLSRGPADSRELWLTAVERSPQGRPLRRVIKVDTVRGVVREHAVYDSEANPLVVARLNDHQPHDGHLIPHSVNLTFPQVKSEMRLTFSELETNPQLPDQLWRLPDHNVEVVDLGRTVRNYLYGRHDHYPEQNPPLQQQQSYNQTYVPPRAQSAPPFAETPAPVFADATEGSQVAMVAPEWDSPEDATGASEFDAFIAEGANSEASLPPAPAWDTPESATSPVGLSEPVSTQQPPQPATGRSSVWRW